MRVEETSHSIAQESMCMVVSQTLVEVLKSLRSLIYLPTTELRLRLFISNSPPGTTKKVSSKLILKKSGKEISVLWKLTNFAVTLNIVGKKLLSMLMPRLLTQSLLPLLLSPPLSMKLLIMKLGVLETSSCTSLDAPNHAINALDHRKLIAQNVTTTGLYREANVLLLSISYFLSNLSLKRNSQD